MIIKNYYPLFVVMHFLCTFMFLVGMNNQNARDIECVALFNIKKAVLAGKKGCFLISNPTEIKPIQRSQCILRHCVYNVVTDKKNQKLGIFTKDSFNVYDITTQKKLWSENIHSTDYSGTFSSTDDTVFLYDNGYLYNNKGMRVQLPSVALNTHVEIECHPKKKELLYPCYDSTLSVLSFEDTIPIITKYSPSFIKTSPIIRAFYSPEEMILHYLLISIRSLSITQKMILQLPSENQIISYMIHVKIPFFCQNLIL